MRLTSLSRAALLGVAALTAAPATSLAQDGKPPMARPVIAPPPVIMRAPPAPPPPRPPAAPSGDRCIAGTRVAVQIDGKDGLGPCLMRRQGWLYLTMGDEDGAVVNAPVPIDLRLAVVMLADRRMEPMWEPLLFFAGNDLGELANRQVELRRTAMERRAPLGYARATLESLADHSTRAQMDYSLALADAGRMDEAISLLDREIAASARPERGGWNRNQQWTWLSLQLRKAQILYNRQNDDRAIAIWQELERTPGLDRSFRINVSMNLAAAYAETGRYQQALDLITTAGEQFARSGGDQIAGSARQFAWIRACALRGLGRRDESETAMQSLDQAEEPQDWGGIALAGNRELRVRAAICLNDVDRLARVLSDPEAQLLTSSDMLQPGVLRRRAELADLREQLFAHPRMTEYAARWRALPGDFQPVLRNFFGSGSDVATATAGAAPTAAPVARP